MSIPRVFHSFEDEGPFSNCIECNRPLLEDNCEYVIEKAVRNYPGYSAQDVIFDYAICLSCANEVQKRISAESMDSIRTYMHNKLSNKQPVEVSENVDEMIGKCIISDKPAESCKEYQIFAFCIGNDLHPNMSAYMISDDILDEIQELLSSETKDELNRFSHKNFPPSPYLTQPDPRLILF